MVLDSQGVFSAILACYVGWIEAIEHIGLDRISFQRCFSSSKVELFSCKTLQLTVLLPVPSLRRVGGLQEQNLDPPERLHRLLAPAFAR